MENDPEVFGFLTSDGILYCSKRCASQRGRPHGQEIGQGDYQGLVERFELHAARVCPKCGLGFTTVPSDRRPEAPRPDLPCATSGI